MNVGKAVQVVPTSISTTIFATNMVPVVIGRLGKTREQFQAEVKAAVEAYEQKRWADGAKYGECE